MGPSYRNPHPAAKLSTPRKPNSQWPSNRLPACSAVRSCSTFPLPRVLVWPPVTAGGTATTSQPFVIAMLSTRSSRTSVPPPLANKRLHTTSQDPLCSEQARMYRELLELGPCL